MAQFGIRGAGGKREQVEPARSASAPGAANSSLPHSAAPPSLVSCTLRAESSPALTPLVQHKGGLRFSSPSGSLPHHPSPHHQKNNLVATMPSTSTNRSADLETSGVVPEERILKLRTRWGIPSSDALVRVLPRCVYKKPRPSHGKLYIFPNHLVFVSHSHHTNVCIPLAEVEQMLRKRHRIHLITHDKKHRLRGGLTQNSTTYEVLLAVWQHARGDTSIDLEAIRAGDKKLQKVIRKRRSSSFTSEFTSGDDDDDVDDDYGTADGSGTDEEDEDAEPTLESHTITLAPKPQEPQWEIPLTPQDRAPPAFAATLVPSADAQNVNRVEALTLSTGLAHCWHLLYDPHSQNVMQSMTKHLLYDITLGQWAPDSEPGVLARTIKYTKPMQSKFVKGDALVEQTQKAVLVSQPARKLYIFQVNRMQGVPYSDSFVIHAVYELTEEGAGKTKIANTAWVVWTKSPPRLLRGKIERGSVAGVEESFKGFIADTEATILAQAQSAPLPSATTSSSSSSSSSSPSSAYPSAPSPPGGPPVAAAGAFAALGPGQVAVVPAGSAVVGAAGVPIVLTTAPAGGLHVDMNYVYAVIGVLLLSVLANVMLAAWR